MPPNPKELLITASKSFILTCFPRAQGGVRRFNYIVFSAQVLSMIKRAKKQANG